MNTVLGNCRSCAVLCRRKYLPQVIVVLIVVIGVATAIAISGCTTPTPEVVVEATIEPEDTAPTYEAEVVVETEGAVVEVPIEPPGTPVTCEVAEEKMAICQDDESYSDWPEKTEFDPDDEVCIVWRGENCGDSGLKIKVYPSGSNDSIVTPTLPTVAGSRSMWNMATPGIALCPGAYETQFVTDWSRPGASIEWSISRPAITRCADVGTVSVTRVTTFSVQYEGRQFQSLALSPDGQTLAVGYADGSITLWRAETGQRVGDPLKGHSEEVADLAFSPDGKRLVSASLDDNNTLILWELDEGSSIIESIQYEGQVHSVAFHPDGEEFASIDANGRVMQWDVDGDKFEAQPSQSVEAKQWYIAYLPSGSRLLLSHSSERNIDFYLEGGSQSISHSYYHVTSMTLRPDWKMFASGDSCGYIHLWDSTSVAAPLLCQLELGSAKPVVSLSFSFNNQWLAAGNAKGDVFLWKIAWP